MDETRKHSILIVSDDESDTLLLTRLLRPEYSIRAARDGQTAIEDAREHAPDLIILDAVMTDMTGYDVLVQLKSSDITQSIPVIFITMLSGAENEEKGLRLGAVDYIIRPFDNAVVRARVWRHLQTVEQIRAIKRMIMIDPLTEIPNRRSFNERLSMEWRRAARLRSPISALMIDLDHFKRYNDLYGHPEGDVLLRNISALFKRSLKRPADFVCRWGGEEFAVILPDSDASGALVVAEQIRGSVEREDFLLSDGRGTHITVSVGINTATPRATDPLDVFISGADKALYAAKAAGRNKALSLSELETLARFSPDGSSGGGIFS